MDTHRDDDMSLEAKKFFGTLETRAESMKRDRLSEITGGKEDEPVLDEWDVGDLHVVHRPDDEQGILRVSVGGGSQILKLDYCVFRGNRTACAYMLEQAAKALRAGHVLPGQQN